LPNAVSVKMSFSGVPGSGIAMLVFPLKIVCA
jgi:hypothetical protein